MLKIKITAKNNSQGEEEALQAIKLLRPIIEDCKVYEDGGGDFRRVYLRTKPMLIDPANPHD